MQNNNKLTAALKERFLLAGVVSMLLSQAALATTANMPPEAPQMDEISSARVFGVPGLSLHEVARQPGRSVFLIKEADASSGPDIRAPNINRNMFLLCAPAKIGELHGYTGFSYELSVRDSDGNFTPASGSERVGQQPLFESVTWLGDAGHDQPGAARSPSGVFINVAVATKACKDIAKRDAPAQGNVERALSDTPANQNCNGRGPMLAPTSPQEVGALVIAPTLPADVMAAIAQGEQRINGELDPEYRNSPRLIVHPDSAPATADNIMVVVPAGMPVAIGQHVTYRTSYADPERACHYFPSTIERVDPQ